MAPHLLDHEPLLETIAKRDPDFGWDDFLSGSKQAASYDERLIGVLRQAARQRKKERFTSAPAPCRLRHAENGVLSRNAADARQESQARGVSGLVLTRCWREPDSNHRFRRLPSNRNTARTRAGTAGTPGAFRGTDGSNPASSSGESCANHGLRGDVRHWVCRAARALTKSKPSCWPEVLEG